MLTPAVVGCTIPEVFDEVRPGEPIWFDDGKIGGVIEKVENSRVLVRITQEHVKAVHLRADKGINLPESDLRLPVMTARDVEDLSFVAQHAEVVELSFASSARDVESLQKHLASLGSRQPAIVLKMETVATGKRRWRRDVSLNGIMGSNSSAKNARTSGSPSCCFGIRLPLDIPHQLNRHQKGGDFLV